MNTAISKDLFPAKGELPVRMTNDLLFHLLLQDPNAPNILKGLISSFQNIEFDEIKSVIVQNPISFGQTIDSKTMICNRFISGYKKAPVVIMTTETL